MRMTADPERLHGLTGAQVAGFVVIFRDGLPQRLRGGRATLRVKAVRENVTGICFDF